MVHVAGAGPEKGTEMTVATLESIARDLNNSVFSVLGYAFDGDSCFERSHDGFQSTWEDQLSSGSFDAFFGMKMVMLLVISDPLHILKRVRYRLLSADLRIGVDNDEREFTTSALQSVANVPHVVLDNSRIIKMLDSLPLHLFSEKLILAVFKACAGQEFSSCFPGLSLFRLSHALVSLRSPDTVCLRPLFGCFTSIRNCCRHDNYHVTRKKDSSSSMCYALYPPANSRSPQHFIQHYCHCAKLGRHDSSEPNWKQHA
jgi:hypothetical protein